MKLVTLEGNKYLKAEFNLSSIEPDTSNYKQRKPLFMPVEEMKVVVNVPFTAENVDNFADISSAILANTDVPAPIFSMWGFEYIASHLAYPQTPSQKPQVADDDDWDDDDDTTAEEAEDEFEGISDNVKADDWDDVEEAGDASPDFDEEWED